MAELAAKIGSVVSYNGKISWAPTWLGTTLYIKYKKLIPFYSLTSQFLSNRLSDPPF